MKRVKVFLCLFLIVLLLTPSCALAWCPVTHYHINKEACPNLFQASEEQKIFYLNGTGPDMFCLWPLVDGPYPLKKPDGSDYDWADFVHSPDPKEESGKKPYWKKQNFAYLKLKVAGHPSNIIPTNKAYSLGWGGHIAADWVAHNRNLFAICPPGSLGEKKHGIGETLYDIYVYATRGPIAGTTSFKMKFNPALIHKALVNYQLIDIYEDKPYLSDEEIKQKALETTLPKTYIKERCTKWAQRLVVMQTGYAATLAKMGPIEAEIFKQSMKVKGAEENIALSENAVYFWINNLPPRNSIPTYDHLVAPFYYTPLACNLIHPTNAFALFWYRLKKPFAMLAPAYAWVEPTNTENSIFEDQAALADETVYGFWGEVAKRAEEAGILQTGEETMADGECAVTVTLTDEDVFEQVLEDVISERFSNPASDLDKRYAGLWKNLIIDEITDIDKLMDVTAPTISDLTPGNNSFTNDQTPTISACIKDDPDGIGVDEKSITLKLNGEDLAYEYIPETGLVTATPPSPLPDGEYEVELKVSDRAGNEAEKTWKFTVDTTPPEINHNVINKIINVKKNTLAAIGVTSNEPITFGSEIFRVKDKQTGNKGEKVYAYTGEDLTQKFTFLWDGRNDEGTLVSNGVYTVKITARDRATNEISFEVQVNVNNEAGK